MDNLNLKGSTFLYTLYSVYKKRLVYTLYSVYKKRLVFKIQISHKTFVFNDLYIMYLISKNLIVLKCVELMIRDKNMSRLQKRSIGHVP